MIGVAAPQFGKEPSHAEGPSAAPESVSPAAQEKPAAGPFGELDLPIASSPGTFDIAEESSASLPSHTSFAKRGDDFGDLPTTRARPSPSAEYATKSRAGPGDVGLDPAPKAPELDVPPSIGLELPAAVGQVAAPTIGSPHASPVTDPFSEPTLRKQVTEVGARNREEPEGRAAASQSGGREAEMSRRLSDSPKETGAPASPSRSRSKGSTPPAPAFTPKKRRGRIAVVVGILALAIGGSALTLVPEAGPFGAYFIVDQIRRGDHERLLAATVAFAHGHLGLDTYSEAQKTMAETGTRARTAKRFKPLGAYAAFTGFARLLRFGAEAPVYARANVTLNELAQAKGIFELDLARATRAAVDGDLARARAALVSLERASPRNVDVAVTRGELELRAKDATAAARAWTAAVGLEKSARTRYGLARALLLSGDAKNAEALATEAVALSPAHIGGRLLMAEAAWGARQDETLAERLLSEVMQHADEAGPEERIEAESLFGEVHLSRGRVTQAEQAFTEAIGIAEAMKLNARARALSGLGETLFRAGRYTQAVARFKASAQADPDDVTALVGIAKSSLLLERVDEAKEMLGKLRKTYAKDARVAHWYGRLEEAIGERKDAETVYRDAIALGNRAEDCVDAYVALASALSADGQPDAANAALAEAQARLPASSSLYKALGRAGMSQGRYGDALSAFERALALVADDLEALFLKATALVRLREFDKAAEALDAVAKIDRDFPGMALERGILFQESGRPEEALREYESAVSKAPNDPDLMLRVGCATASAGGGDFAEQMLRKVLQQRPGSAETHFCLGRALMARHDLGDALKEFERAIQIDPNHAEYHLYVGWACNESGSLPKAAAALKRALELDQGLAEAYWQRGVLRVRQARPKDALDDLNKALELRPSCYEAYADLALAYYDLGKEDLALAEWQKAIAAKPNEASWRFQYGKLLNLRLQNAAAAEQLSKAIDLAAPDETPPPWLPEAHRIAAVCLGNSRAAIPHWQAFLKTGPANSPYRKEAKAALKRLGAPWQE